MWARVFGAVAAVWRSGWYAILGVSIGVVMAGSPKVSVALAEVLGYAFVTVLAFCGLVMVVGAAREAAERRHRAHEIQSWDGQN